MTQIKKPEDLSYMGRQAGAHIIFTTRGSAHLSDTESQDLLNKG